MKKQIKITILVLLSLFIVVITLGVVFIFNLPFSGDDGLSREEIFKLVLNNKQLLTISASEIYELGYNELYIEKETNNEKVTNIRITVNNKEDKLENEVLLQTLKIKGILDITKYDSKIEYYCGGFGFGPSTSYVGFCYMPYDTFYNLMENSEFEKEGDGYKRQEKDGDNSYYIERIIDDFYYYKLSY
jgi:hypothetical protein